MEIMNLLKDTAYLAELLNGPCAPGDFEGGCKPLRPEWIDEERSDYVTVAYHAMLPAAMPYITCVKAERNPDTQYSGTCVDDNEKRQRYFLITVVPDTDFPYDSSYPLLLFSGVANLHFWENVRAILEASEQWMKVVIATEPVPPILNSARIEWVTLYLGRKPFRGITKLSDQWAEAKDFDGFEMNVHLYEVRNMEPCQTLQRLIDAYDKDFPLEEPVE